MKVTDLLKELEELIERGNAVPFSSKAMISPDEALESREIGRASCRERV